MNWQPYEEGKTIGKTGSEGGVIQADDEHLAGARITLEQGCLHAPYGITCGVYGWMVHTRFFADEETAQHAYGEMKPALGSIVDLMPGEDDADESNKLNAMQQAIDDFTARFQ